jgi:hypothetical protein
VLQKETIKIYIENYNKEQRKKESGYIRRTIVHLKTEMIYTEKTKEALMAGR